MLARRVGRVGYRRVWRSVGRCVFQRAGLPTSGVGARVVACRAFATGGVDNSDHGFVRRLNACFHASPGVSAAYVLGLDLVNAAACFCFVYAADFHPSPDWALAFALSRPLKQVRLPAELLCAAALAKVAPDMTRVQFSIIFNYLTNRQQQQAAQAGNPQQQQDERSFGARATKAASAAMDKYGMAYLVASKVVGVASLLGLYAAVKHGVDLASVFQQWGLSAAGDAIGMWGASVVGGTFLWPFGIAAAPAIIPRLAQAVDR